MQHFTEIKRARSCGLLVWVQCFPAALARVRRFGKAAPDWGGRQPAPQSRFSEGKGTLLKSSLQCTYTGSGGVKNKAPRTSQLLPAPSPAAIPRSAQPRLPSFAASSASGKPAASRPHAASACSSPGTLPLAPAALPNAIFLCVFFFFLFAILHTGSVARERQVLHGWHCGAVRARACPGGDV